MLQVNALQFPSMLTAPPMLIALQALRNRALTAAPFMLSSSQDTPEFPSTLTCRFIVRHLTEKRNTFRKQTLLPLKLKDKSKGMRNQSLTIQKPVLNIKWQVKASTRGTALLMQTAILVALKRSASTQRIA